MANFFQYEVCYGLGRKEVIDSFTFIPGPEAWVMVEERAKLLERPQPISLRVLCFVNGLLTDILPCPVGTGV